MTETAETIAAQVGQEMHARDPAPQALGIKMLEMRPGMVRLSMTVRPDMLNFHATCHGGIIYALADSAFGYTCNSHNKITVAQHCSITYLAPAKAGDVLIATAEERHRASRTGITDITVTDQDGRLIAIFRGHSYQLQGKVVPTIGTVEP